MITIVQTKDNSPTLYSEQFDQTYHSIYGAVQESEHVFIANGLDIKKDLNAISIFEMGYGTGINAMLSLQYAQKNSKNLIYVTIEKFPVESLLYADLTFENQPMSSDLKMLNDLPWTEKNILPYFQFTKLKGDLCDLILNQTFDVIYFDAFSPNAQPELWSVDVFQRMNQMLNKNGILVTYCAKGVIKRNLRDAGYRVDAKPGPPGKREMTVATKID
jgi:tRNA U34 5-methylaminomethyl-2-thiouridine-forming methyltransferase MnmC